MRGHSTCILHANSFRLRLLFTKKLQKAKHPTAILQPQDNIYNHTCMHQDILYSMDAEDKCTFTLKEMEYYACVTYKGIRHIGTKNLHV